MTTDHRVNVVLTYATDASQADVLAAVATAASKALGPAGSLEAVSVHAFDLDEDEEAAL